MRAPFHLACWAMVAVWGAVADDGAAASRYAPSPLGTTGVASGAPRRLLEPVDVAADRETVAYLLPRLAAKYRPSGEWADVADPRFYVLTEMAEAAAAAQADVDDAAGYGEQGGFFDSRAKRSGRFRDPVSGGPGGSLSIVNSLDVLRNRLLLEIARKKAKEGATRNRQMLMNLGKRALYYDKF